MRHTIVLRLLATLLFLGPALSIEAAVPPTSPVPATVSNPQITATMMKMPLQFEANHGQVDAQVQFLARGTGYTLFLTPTESVMVLQQREAPTAKDPLAMSDTTVVPEAAPIKQSVVRMKLEGANPSPAIDGMEPLPGIVNYFIGNDPEKWRTKIPTYAKVQYQQAYPGIDLAYYGNQGRLEYDFIVAPGADPKQIKLAFEGPSDIRVAESGDLLLTTALGEVKMQKPIVYQLETDGHKTLVAGQYVLEAHAMPLQASRTARYSVGFQLASYDHTKSVVIDPVLVYSTYLGGSGGSGGDGGTGIAVDAAGQAYVTGATDSTNFPTATPFQATFNGHRSDAFVTKLNAAGTSLLYSTYLGGSGSSRGDGGSGIAVDAAGQAYVTGSTGSANFPTATPFQAALAGGQDAFVTKISDSVTNQLPVCSAAQANPAAIWSPNHQFVPIVVMGVTDPDGDSLTITVTGVTQDEPVTSTGSGNTSPDAVIQAGAASVRAERSENGNGRVYQIAFTADDGNGGSCTGAVTVGVPHSQNKGLTPVNDGQIYNSTIP